MRRLILLTLLGLSTFARAQGVSQIVDSESLADQRQEQRLRLSLGSVNYRYEEPGYMKISGRMSQIAGDYRFNLRPTTPMFIAVETSFTFSGSNTYDGGLQNLDTGKITPKSEGSRDYIVETRGIYNITALNGYAQGLDTFGGIGIWALYNKIAGEGSYGRQATYLYLPLGTTYNVRLNRVLLSLTGEYDLYLTGQTTSQMTDVGGSNDIVHQQNSGSGWRAKFGGEYRFNGWTLLAGVYHQIWNIGQSEYTSVNIKKSNGTSSQGVIVEPKNNTSMTGITLGARF